MFTPLGENTPITLTLAMVANDIATPTRTGALPDERDCLRFMNLCKGRQLNPWTGDCFMIGYDTKTGAKFELITSYQSLLKRSESSVNFDGIEGGVVIETAEGLEYRPGTIVAKDETLVGGWAKAYRQDRRIPHEARVQLSTYSTGQSRWSVDPAGMIAKVAKAAALREAFPNIAGGLYVQEEMGHVQAELEQFGELQVPEPSLIEHSEPEVSEQPRDWKAEFKAHSVMEQAGLLRDSPTEEDRQSILRAAKSQVGDAISVEAYDCLVEYAEHRKTQG